MVNPISIKKGHKAKTIKYDSEEAVRKALLEIIIFICFLIVTTIVALAVRHLYMYYFNKAIQILFLSRDTMTKNNYNVEFGQLVTTSDWWSFLENTFLDDLHGANESQESVDDDLHQLFLQENLLLGPPRLRQIRVLEGTCKIHDIFTKYFDACYAAYSSSIEDQRAEHKGTKFFTLAELNAISLWGHIGDYIGGGYVQNLTNSRSKNQAILKELKSRKWIDRGTRVVIVEFALFNGNTDLFANVKFIAEMPPTGGIIPSAQLQALKLYALWTEKDYVIITAAIIFYLMVIFYTVEECREMKKSGIMLYVQSLWNIVDFLIIILAYLSFIYNIWHPLYLREVLEGIENKTPEHQSLDIICFWNMIYTDVMAICAFLVWIKVFKYISFNKTMLQFSTTIRRCSKDLFGFGVMFAIVFLAYAQLGLLLFGTKHPDFRNFKESLLTMMRMVLGDFEYSAIEDANRVLGPIYFLTYILLVFFILLNMFLAIINDTYSAVKSEITSGSNHLQIFIAKQFRNISTNCRSFMKKLRKRDIKNNTNNIPEEIVTEATLYAKTSPTTDYSEEPLRLRKSQILRDYFEEVPEISIVTKSTEDMEEFKRLGQRVAQLEDIMEQLVGNMDKILQRVSAKKHAKNN